MSETRQFLEALMGDGLPSPHAAVVFTLPDRKSTRYSKPTLALPYVERTGEQQNAYIGVGVIDQQPEQGKRGKAEDVSGIFGMWADIDIAGPAHDTNKAYPPDLDAALKVAHADLEPTVVVDSGHGIHVWWLFPEPWLFEEGDRPEAARLAEEWSRLLKARARGKGWDIDSTHDLARVLRVPGTMNLKDENAPVPVKLLLADGPRCGIDDFQDVLKECTVNLAPEPKQNKPAQPVDLADQDLLEKMLGAKNGERVRRLWQGDSSDYPSHSEADAALCCHLAYWTGRDPERMDSMFRRSGLVRDKWTEREDYRTATIDSAIDRTVEVYTPKAQPQTVAEVRTPEPEGPPPDLAQLLDALVVFLERYIVFSHKAQVPAVALWTAHTWVFDHFEVTPYLSVTSPEKRCGKTRVFDVLEHLVRRPWRQVTPSEAVLYRKIASDKPTLMLDETDAIFGPHSAKQYEGVRALLNAGYRRGQTVPRCVGDGSKMQVVDFPVFSPKAFAGIGKHPDTVADRSIPVRLRRKARHEHVERLRYREIAAEAEAVRAELSLWAHGVDLRGTRPELPDELDDRAQDSWEPLLAIAEAAGEEWANRARQVAVVLMAGRVEDDASIGVKLLADAKVVFDGDDRLTTHDLLGRLKAIEESPWSDWRGGKGLNPKGLAGMLKPYGIEPKDHRFPVGIRKGYLKDDFKDAWKRYLDSAPTSETDDLGQQGQLPCKSQENEGQQDPFPTSDVAGRKPPICREVADVAGESPYSPGVEL